MKRAIILIFILLIHSSCKPQDNKKTSFENLIKKVVQIDSFPVIEKKYFYEPPTLTLTEDNSYKYLELKREDIYYKEEFYNHDEDIRTYGDEKPCFPIVTSKYKNDDIIFLFITEYTGFESGDIANTFLYAFSKGGKKISKTFLKDEMIDLEGIPFTAFAFLDKNHFNTYVYNLKEVQIDEKQQLKTFVTTKEYKINNNGEITILKTSTQKEYLEEGNYTSINFEEWPSNDPMKLLLREQR